MTAVGIICEYNPFHNGHKHQIAQAKKLSGCDACVCVMSGSFVQRGEVAVYDKWSRTKAALENGADLVIELPAWYVLQSADVFAKGGIEILTKSSLVDAISFGSESADGDALMRCAKILTSEDAALKLQIKKIMQSGASYPAALQSAMDVIYPEISDYIKNPNDMLGVAYISAMLRCGADFKIYPVARHMAEHHSTETDGIYASSTAIRNAIAKGSDVSALIPYELSGDTYRMSNLENFILGFYRTCNADNLKNLPLIEDGFENKLISAAKQATSLDEFYQAMVSRRYTLSRVKRTVLAGIIGMDKGRECDYVRVLGMTDKGAALLKESKEKTRLPFVVKTADFTPSTNSTFEYDILATDIAALACENVKNRKSGSDFYNSPVKI
ncbi:MAG: nucleotidyltransferase family protein [Clostridia bacterium]|nr:nucleotidyltransferase family protein [Clostridia bacterium]